MQQNGNLEMFGSFLFLWDFFCLVFVFFFGWLGVFFGCVFFLFLFNPEGKS